MTLTGEDIYFETCRYSRYMLTVCGIWPYQGQYSTYFFRCFWILQHTTITLSEFMRIVEIRDDIDHVLQCVPPLMYNVICIVKFSHYFYNIDKMKYVLDLITKDWNRLSGKKEISILTAYTKKTAFLADVYVYMAITIIFLYMFLPLSPVVLDIVTPMNVSRKRKPLYEVEFFVDPEKYFYPILIHAYITALAGVCLIIGVDTIIASYTQHACGMFVVLRHRIEAITERNADRDYFTVEKNDDVMYNELKDCIIQHKIVLEFADLLASTFDMSFLYHLCVILPLISITGFVAVVNWGDPEMVRCGAFAGAQSTHLLFNCIPGEDLLEYSQGVYHAAYNFLWYKSSRRCRQLVQIMMMRGAIPSRITAGSLYVMSVDNFASVMKTAMSFFTMIKSTR